MNNKYLSSFFKIALATLSLLLLGSMNGENEFRISQFTYDEKNFTADITWSSKPGEVFSIEYSTDLDDWSRKLSSDIPAAIGNTTTRNYNLLALGLPNLDKFFVRVKLTNTITTPNDPHIVDPNKPPNIVFLMTDDQTFYSVGIYGNPDVKTPNMDKLGRDGVIFDRHYNTTAICMASRANVFTGLYEYKTGCNFVYGEQLKKSLWDEGYSQILRNNGYRTGFAGKFGFPIENVGWGNNQFDVYAGMAKQGSYETSRNGGLAAYAAQYPHTTLAYGAWARDFIKTSSQQDKPFCMSISFKAPHRPVQPDPRFDSVYAGKVFTKPGNFGRAFGAHRPDQSRGGRQYDRFISWNYDSNYDGVMAKYHQQVYGVDVALGMIRQALVDNGVDKNTIIIFTSDNGFLCGSHGFGSKVLPFEESSRVPLMIYDPRKPNTTGGEVRTKSLTGNIDFAPTILDLAGLPIPTNMDGKSLVPMISNPLAPGHDQLALMSTYTARGDNSALSVMSGNFKYTYWWKTPIKEELYDIENDPLEGTNLISDPTHNAKLQEMRQKYDNQVTHWKQNRIMEGGAANAVSTYERFGNNFTRQ